MPDAPSFRILDAALNRATEGLRVVEDYARFVLDDAHLSRHLKELRHELAAAASEAIPLADRHAMRDTPGDVGTAIATDSEAARTDARHVCRANCERVKQSLRTLEEFGKCLDLPPADGSVAPKSFALQMESLRYRFYGIEAALTRTSQPTLEGVRLCVLVDGRDSLEEFDSLIGELTAAGVGMIQLRDKQLDDRSLLARASMLARGGSNPPSGPRPVTIINDRPDIAAIAKADGVHLGQDDLPLAEARRILGPGKLIGVSTHSIEQARAAVLAGADYLGAGPTFPSRTKSFDEFPGLDYLRQVAADIRLPTFAIGGIDATNIDAVLNTGIGRVAISSAVTGAVDPAATVRAFQSQLAARATDI